MSNTLDGTFAVATPRCSGHRPTEDCRYRIAWQINPHMRPGAADAVRAEAQHRTLVAELRRAGAEVIELPFVHGAFDSVFIKDNALLREVSGTRLALLSRFAEDVRQREQADRAHALREHGFEILQMPDVLLEGGDVARYPDGSAFLGHGFRSEKRAEHLLSAFIDGKVVALELTDPWLYHLDTALAVLNDGTVLCCREAFSESSVRRLFAHAGNDVLFVPREEALGFALNLVQVGDTVLTGSAAPITRRLLEERGLRVQPLKLTEFQLAGGSAACLVSRLYVERRVAISDTSAMRSTSE